jgi:AcrR family transcriptional regulator
MEKRSNNPAAMRAKILQFAGEELSRYGFHAWKLNTVVERAGITKGSLFHHFKSKEDLMMQWIEQTLPPLLEEEWLAPLASADPISVLQQIFRLRAKQLEQVAANDFVAHPLAILTASVQADDHALLALLRGLHRQWLEGVSHALRDGQKNKSVHSAIVAEEEAGVIVAASSGVELLVKTQGATIVPGFLRSTIAYLETLRPA